MSTGAVADKIKVGRPRKANGNINELCNRNLKQLANRNWYYEKGYLIHRIKSLVSKYKIDANECPYASDYNRKNNEQLHEIIRKLSEWILQHSEISLFDARTPQPRIKLITND